MTKLWLDFEEKISRDSIFKLRAQTIMSAFVFTADGASQCYDCGYLIDGWTEEGPNYQHPMTDGTPQVGEVCPDWLLNLVCSVAMRP